MIPYGRQKVTQADIDAVVDVLRSDFLTQGPCVPRFEKKLSQYCGVKHGVAVNSATSALHIACLALGLTKDDYLWTSPVTFVASANCGVYCGANIDFVDIDPDTFNICSAALSKKLEVAEKENRLPKVLVAVHLCGLPCDMEAIHTLSLKYGFRIIEDASHAVGGAYKGVPIGSCQFSDICVFSFHPVKIITTAEGGMAMTNSDDFAEKMALYRSHGVTRDEEQMASESDGPWYYEQIALGFNYRMTELQAALGVSQLDRLDQFVARRRQLADLYGASFADLPIHTQQQPKDAYSGFHLYVIRLKLNELKPTHRQIFEALRENGIGVNLHYIPVHTQPFYKNMGFAEGDFPEAEKYYADAISLPLFPDLSEKDQQSVVTALKAALHDK